MWFLRFLFFLRSLTDEVPQKIKLPTFHMFKWDNFQNWSEPNTFCFSKIWRVSVKNDWNVCFTKASPTDAFVKKALKWTPQNTSNWPVLLQHFLCRWWWPHQGCGGCAGLSCEGRHPRRACLVVWCLPAVSQLYLPLLGRFSKSEREKTND